MHIYLHQPSDSLDRLVQEVPTETMWLEQRRAKAVPGAATCNWQRTLWPSGLRRWLKAPFRKGVGSNPTGVIFIWVSRVRRPASFCFSTFFSSHRSRRAIMIYHVTGCWHMMMIYHMGEVARETSLWVRSAKRVRHPHQTSARNKCHGAPLQSKNIVPICIGPAGPQHF